MQGIGKSFSGKAVLRNVNITIQEGSIHAIVGENGAGKSTLMNILCGVLQPTTGSIRMDGEICHMSGPNAATSLGIGMVHQHFMLVPMLKVWQNIILGVEPENKLGIVDQKIAFQKIQDACNAYGTTLDLEQDVSKLPVGAQQRVEIIKVLYRKAKYIILDEPTAVLTPEEIDQLMGSVRALKAQGKTILFISHKLSEVLEVSDQISVLRQGEFIGTVNAAETSAEELVAMMVGREVHIDGHPLATTKSAPVLEVSSICTRPTDFGCALHNVSLAVRGGEILGIAGVDGNGQQELVESIMGLMRIESGEVCVRGKHCTNQAPSKIRHMGVACIPPDRQEQGLVLDSSVTRNTVLGFEDLPRFRKGFLLSKKAVEAETTRLMQAFDVRCASIHNHVRGLSGGNQQKVILARECGLTDPHVMIAVNPTRGLDIGAIEFVYTKLEEYKAQGKCILLVSTELSEIMRLSDRIAVLFHGRVMDTLDNEHLAVQELGSLMMGIEKGGAAV